MTAQSFISEAKRNRILDQVSESPKNRPQHLGKMKQRQALGIQIACKAAQILKENFHVKQVTLFGSILKCDSMHERSDIDLVVWGLSTNQLIPAGCAIDRRSLPMGLGEIDLVHCEVLNFQTDCLAFQQMLSQEEL